MLNKQLVLFRYILKQFGYETFEALRNEFNNKETSPSTTGSSYFAAILSLRAEKTLDNYTLLSYDEAIQGYEKRLRDHRAEPYLSFKYYQWFALLFSEYYLDQYAHHSQLLLDKLNEYKQGIKEYKHLSNYTPNDLKKLAYWMATGSGKTLLMHCNYWQITKYISNWENILLITPNEGLSQQHYQSLIESGIAAKLYTGSEDSLKTRDGEVLIIEITKLVSQKEGQGVSVSVDYFSENKNLVFIDEGHKGQRSEEQVWKNLREQLTKGAGSFTFEYSATFGQIISAKTDALLQEYSKAILFDYSYRHFYGDGYGKDFTVFNLDVKNDYSDEQNRLLFTASLLGFYEQLALFEAYKTELSGYNIEKPLWIFVGSKVIGGGSGTLTQTDKQNVSDVSSIIKYFKLILSNPSILQHDITRLLGNQSGLLNALGDDIFKPCFGYLKQQPPTAEDVLLKVFHHIGSLDAYTIKQADGEIGLRTSIGNQYFGVINIGDVPKYAKKLEEDTNGELLIQDDNFTKSLFQSISSPNSPIHILIGSKKFVEGWSSWRVSSMGLMNMGKSEGSQIIQLFGRGVRLKGKGFSLKREESDAPYYLKALQTISIMGLNASYMNRFLEEINKEVAIYHEHKVAIQYNHKQEWNGKIITFATPKGRDFKDEIVVLQYELAIAKRVTVDLRNKMSMATSGFNSQVANDGADYQVNFLRTFMGFINFNELFIEANRYRLLRGYTNLILDNKTIETLVKAADYNLYSHAQQFKLADALSGKIQEIAGFVVKDYLSKFYADREKDYLARYLTYQLLDETTHQDLFPASGELIIKVPNDYEHDFADFENLIEQLYKKDDKLIPTLHFDKHLYTPLTVWASGKKFEEIKTVPVRLNEGETKFLDNLRTYLAPIGNKLQNKAVFVLRNLSQKGVGFSVKNATFYPDFIIWVVAPNQQHIYLLDPKGIRETRNFNNAKVIFCKEYVPILAKKINDELQNDNMDLQITLHAYILSVSKFKDVAPTWGSGSGTSRDEFTNNNILFMDDTFNLLNTIFGHLL